MVAIRRHRRIMAAFPPARNLPSCTSPSDCVWFYRPPYCYSPALLHRRPRNRTVRRTSLSSWPTTWASPTSAATAREIATPNLDRLAAGGLAVHAVLQHGALLPDARVAADRPLPAPGRRRAHGRQDRGMPGLSGLSQRPLRHDRRGARAGRLPHADGRQVARRQSSGRTGRCDRGFDRYFGADQRRQQLLPARPGPA